METKPSACTHDQEQCPLCLRANSCQMANGRPYKGPCWCEQIVIPENVLKRLAEVLPSDACLCRSCLETVARLAREQNDPDVILAEARKTIAAG